MNKQDLTNKNTRREIFFLNMKNLFDGRKLKKPGADKGCYLQLDCNELLVDEKNEQIFQAIEFFYELLEVYDETVHETEQVFQWRVKYPSYTSWELSNRLCTEEHALKLFASASCIEKHAGPFEVRK